MKASILLLCCLVTGLTARTYFVVDKPCMFDKNTIRVFQKGWNLASEMVFDCLESVVQSKYDRRANKLIYRAVDAATKQISPHLPEHDGDLCNAEKLLYHRMKMLQVEKDKCRAACKQFGDAGDAKGAKTTLSMMREKMARLNLYADIYRGVVQPQPDKPCVFNKENVMYWQQKWNAAAQMSFECLESVVHSKYNKRLNEPIALSADLVYEEISPALPIHDYNLCEAEKVLYYKLVQFMTGRETFKITCKLFGDADNVTGARHVLKTLREAMTRLNQSADIYLGRAFYLSKDVKKATVMALNSVSDAIEYFDGEASRQLREGEDKHCNVERTSYADLKEPYLKALDTMLGGMHRLNQCVEKH